MMWLKTALKIGYSLVEDDKWLLKAHDLASAVLCNDDTALNKIDKFPLLMDVTV